MTKGIRACTCCVPSESNMAWTPFTALDQGDPILLALLKFCCWDKGSAAILSRVPPCSHAIIAWYAVSTAVALAVRLWPLSISGRQQREVESKIWVLPEVVVA